MNKVIMPIPVGYQWLDTAHFRKHLPEQSNASEFRHLITTDQAEAYKDACVREALEEAAQICWEMQSRPEHGKDYKDHWLAIAERRIRALIPPTE